MANIEKVTIELVGGARLTVRQDGDTVEITTDVNATYEVVGTKLELRFAQSKPRRQPGRFSPEREGW